MLTRRDLLKVGAVASAGVLVPWKWNVPRAVALQQQVISLDPITQPKFVYPVPNALAPSFIYGARKQKDRKYEVGMFQIQQNLGLIDPSTGAPLVTTVWGYGEKGQKATYPGRTFEVRRGRPLNVQWTNNLVDAAGNPLPHLVPVDTSIHWAFSLPGYESYALEQNGVPVVPHLHGGHTESASDGLPEYFWTPGEAIRGPRFLKSLYTYDNDQEPGTLWYHDHALGITRLNVYAGLAGFYIIRDDDDTGLPNNPLGLPAFPYEVALAIQDRRFDVNGQLLLPTNLADEGFEGDQPPNGVSIIAEFFGDHILVNGVIWPKMDVEQRHYRLRLLNGSDSRFYVLKLTVEGSDTPIPFYQIGTDVGFLHRPVQINQLILGPGERADLVVDFSEFAMGTRVMMRNVGPDEPFGGLPVDVPADPQTTGLVMAFDVVVPLDTDSPDMFDPNVTLRADGGFSVAGAVAKTRRLALFEGTDSLERLQPLLGVAEPTRDVQGNIVDGSLGWFEPITENPGLGDVEVWEIYNVTEDAHPIHLHLVSFEILDRESFTATVEEVPQPQHDDGFGTGGRITDIVLGGDARPPEPNERGPKDTAQMYPGEVTRVKAKFDRPGRYVWHCHILSHEDHEMMRPYQVGP